MLNELAFRNARRSMRDYLVYLLTMTGVAALMFAFNFMSFSGFVRKMSGEVPIMALMIGVVTFFIVLIVAWLINYMVHFMLERRSREFGTYLLLGMRKKQLSRLYMRENLLLGSLAFLMGSVAGLFLEQVLMSIFYSLLNEEYRISVQPSVGGIVMTLSSYFGCYLLALSRNKRIFNRMSISGFMRMEAENEKVRESREGAKQWLFFAAMAYFAVFFALMFRGHYKPMPVMLLSMGFLAAIYLIYIGLASFVTRLIRRGGEGIDRGSRLFLLRQLSSKLKTMRFTMGTLTVLFCCALLGVSVAMMFAGFQRQAIETAIPFDVMVYSEDPKEDFREERELLEERTELTDSLVYRIYQDGTHEINDYLYTHVSSLGNAYRNPDGSLNEDKVKDGKVKDGEWSVYFRYDTYMKLGDYNKLRVMLGYSPVPLGPNEYAIHIKPRLEKDLDDAFFSGGIRAGGRELAPAGVYTENFSQNGMNGADYLLIVPDEVGGAMEPYYSLFAAGLAGKPDPGLQESLENLWYGKRGIMPEEEFSAARDRGELPEDAEWEGRKLYAEGTGSDQMMTFGSSVVMVADILEDQMLAIVSSVTFPLTYISLVFLCVALTILAVQQLSDSSRYRYRYDVLRKLGMDEREIGRTVLKQLTLYYLTPMAVAVALSAVIAVFAGEKFIFYTGASAASFSYFGMALLVFGGVYGVYFAATYVGFRRNVGGTPFQSPAGK